MRDGLHRPIVLFFSIILMSITALTAHAQAAVTPWKIIQTEGGLFAHSPQLNLDIRLFLTGKQSKKINSEDLIVDWISPVDQQHPEISLLVYQSGKKGKWTVHRAVIIHTEKKRIIGDAPLKYLSASKKIMDESPEWNWKKGTLTVSDPRYKEKLVFALE